MHKTQVEEIKDMHQVLSDTIRDLCKSPDNRIYTSSEFTNLIGKFLIRMGSNLDLDIIPEYYTMVNGRKVWIDFAYFEKTTLEKDTEPLIVLEHEQRSTTGLRDAVDRLIGVKADFKVVIWWSEYTGNPKKTALERIVKEKEYINSKESNKNWLIIIGNARKEKKIENETQRYSSVTEKDFVFDND